MDTNGSAIVAPLGAAHDNPSALSRPGELGAVSQGWPQRALRPWLVWLQTALACVCVGCDSGNVPEATAPPDRVQQESIAAVGLQPPVIDEILQSVEIQAHLSVERNTPWELAHAMLGLGPEAEVAGENGRDRMTLREYFVRGGAYHARTTFVLHNGAPDVRVSDHAGQFQRHPAQFLAYFALSGLSASTSITTEEGAFTLDDLLETACRQYDPDVERSWLLIAVMLYRGTTFDWDDQFGRRCSTRMLIEAELAERGRLRELPCGGAHRLFALALALKQRGAGASANESPWSDIRLELSDRVSEVRARQLADGSLPGYLTSARLKIGDVGDRTARLHSTGHTLEWLCIALSDSERDSPWVRNCVDWLARTIAVETYELPPAGAYYHGLHALRMYQDQPVSR